MRRAHRQACNRRILATVSRLVLTGLFQGACAICLIAAVVLEYRNYHDAHPTEEEFLRRPHPELLARMHAEIEADSAKAERARDSVSKARGSR